MPIAPLLALLPLVPNAPTAEPLGAGTRPPRAQDERPQRPEIDLAQFPDSIRPFLEPSEGLDGLEQSLTLQVGIATGMLVLGDEAPEDFGERGFQQGLTLDAFLRAALGTVKGTGPGTVKGGALWYDTGVRLSPDRQNVEIVRAPEFLYAPSEDIDTLLERRRLVHGMREGLGKEDAKALQELVDEATPEDVTANPWLMHAASHLMFMSIGAFDDYAEGMRESGTPFGTWEEFQDRVIRETAKALIEPLHATPDAEVLEGRNFRYEGEVVLQVVDPKQNADWDAPEAALAANAADRGPILLVQVTPKHDRSMKVQFGRITLGMLVGGEHRVLYDGPYPVRERTK